ncbi:MAG: DUF4231 domain-containing protein [Cryobacterium sp.]
MMQLAPLCVDADATANATQRAFLRMHRTQLTLIVLAAFVGVFPLATARPPVNWSGVIAATLFGISLLLRLLMVQRKDEDVWYSARQTAEVSKSLCYRYAFGGPGFERALPGSGDEERAAVDSAAERRFVDAFATLGEDIVLVHDDSGADASAGYGSGFRPDSFSEVTEDMHSIRTLAFAELRSRYFDSRIRDQERWYAAKAAFHARRSQFWLTLMLVAEVAGMLFGILKAVQVLEGAPGELVGLMSAFAAAFLAWSQLRQHSMLASTYQHETVLLRDLGRRVVFVDESDWPAFVGVAEDSINAEHARWQGLLGYGR